MWRFQYAEYDWSQPILYKCDAEYELLNISLSFKLVQIVTEYTRMTSSCQRDSLRDSLTFDCSCSVVDGISDHKTYVFNSTEQELCFYP